MTSPRGANLGIRAKGIHKKKELRSSFFLDAILTNDEVCARRPSLY